MTNGKLLLIRLAKCKRHHKSGLNFWLLFKKELLTPSIMRFLRLLYVLIFITLVVGCKTAMPEVIVEKTTFEKLASIPNLVKIEKRNIESHFDENYEVWFEQPIDHDNLSKGTFKTARSFKGLRAATNLFLLNCKAMEFLVKQQVNWQSIMKLIS